MKLEVSKEVIYKRHIVALAVSNAVLLMFIIWLIFGGLCG